MPRTSRASSPPKAAPPLTQSELDEQKSLETAEALAMDGRIPHLDISLREHTARGTIINGTFRVGLAGLTLLRTTAVAAFLTPSELGVWGAVLITVMTLLYLKNSAIGDKYIQQSEDDQEVAFQRAITFEVTVTLGFLLVTAALLPVFAVAYDNSTIVLPGLVLLLAALGSAFQAPTWIFYRRMDFFRQRVLESVDPVVGFTATIALAAAGLGYWCLVLGLVIGSWSGAVVALIACPYRIKSRLDWATAREYFSFSWPLFIAGFGAIVVAQGSVLAGSHAVGIAGVGAISLAVSLTAFAAGVDAVVTETLYPAICAVQDRLAVLQEVFVKSNRVALMWGMSFGLGVALFASDLVHYVLGDRWEPAIILLQAFGVIVALNQLGFNWAAFLRARNETRPIAIVAATTAISFAAITIPLLFIDGLRGYAIGMLAMTLITITARSYFLARLFSGFQMIRHAGRAIAPSVPAVLIVLGLRLLEPAGRGPGTALAELVVYLIVTVVATLILERPLLRELLSYLRPKRVVAV
jgi:O-antigen/teichoic acid export membrane protein